MGSEAFIIDGTLFAKHFEEELLHKRELFYDSYRLNPGLAIIRIGDDAASELYVSTKGQKAKSLGFLFKEHYFPSTVTQNEVKECIAELNKDECIHGIVLQLPLPSRLDKSMLIELIDPSKDVDGLHPINLGKVWQGTTSGLVPCTPQGCMMLLKEIHPSLSGKNILVIGASALVGRPMAGLLLNANATITLAHSLTQDLPELCKRAEIIIVAIGDPQFIKADWIQPAATVIDVGINRLPNGQIVGDVDFEHAVKIAGAITPVPGGVGPMTVACLMKNTLVAAERLLRQE